MYKSFLLSVFILSVSMTGQAQGVDPAVDLMCRADAREAAARIYKACLNAHEQKSTDLMSAPATTTPSSNSKKGLRPARNRGKSQQPVTPPVIEVNREKAPMEMQLKGGVSGDDSVMDIPDPVPIETSP